MKSMFLLAIVHRTWPLQAMCSLLMCTIGLVEMVNPAGLVYFADARCALGMCFIVHTVKNSDSEHILHGYGNGHQYIIAYIQLYAFNSGDHLYIRVFTADDHFLNYYYYVDVWPFSAYC